MKKDSLAPSALQEWLMALSTTRKILVVVVVLGLLGAGFYYQFYGPQTKQIAKLRTDIAKEEKRLAELKEAAAKVEVLEKDLAKAEADLAAMLRLLPDQKEIPGLLDQVSGIGAEVGLENLLFKPQNEEMHEFYAVVPVALDMIGEFHQVGLFLDKISELDRIVAVENLSLSRQGNSPRLKVGCRLVTYRFVDKPPEAVKAAPAKGGKKKKK